MSVIDARLTALGLALPRPLQLPPGVVLPFPWVRVVGTRALISGHGPTNADGSLAAPRGKVGTDVSPEQAYAAARLTGLAILAASSASSATSTGSPDGRASSAWSTRRRDSIASPR
jgi:hypothetical protein